jgi:hypothetical protein
MCLDALRPVDQERVADAAPVGFPLPPPERRVARPCPAPGVVVERLRATDLVDARQALLQAGSPAPPTSCSSSTTHPSGGWSFYVKDNHLHYAHAHRDDRPVVRGGRQVHVASGSRGIVEDHQGPDQLHLPPRHAGPAGRRRSPGSQPPAQHHRRRGDPARRRRGRAAVFLGDVAGFGDVLGDEALIAARAR